MDLELTEVVRASVQNQDTGFYYHAGQILREVEAKSPSEFSFSSTSSVMEKKFSSVSQHVLPFPPESKETNVSLNIHKYFRGFTLTTCVSALKFNVDSCLKSHYDLFSF